MFLTPTNEAQSVLYTATEKDNMLW